MEESQTSFSSDVWHLWQLLDSALPTGGFAHSGGLEAAWQHGLIRDGDGLARFIRDLVRQTAHASTPIMLAVARSSKDYASWDAFYDTTLCNHVANRASRAQGRALLATVSATFDAPILQDAEVAARTGVPCHFACHLPTAFGLTAGVLGLDDRLAAAGYLFFTVRGAISSAVRLGLVGPIEGQRIQAGLGDWVGQSAELAREILPAEIAQTAFFADLLQGTQDRLYSRLFQS